MPILAQSYKKKTNFAKKWTVRLHYSKKVRNFANDMCVFSRNEYATRIY